MKVNHIAVIALVIAVIAVQSYADKNGQMVTTSLQTTGTPKTNMVKEPEAAMPQKTMPATDLKTAQSPMSPLAIPEAPPMEEIKPAETEPMPSMPIIDSPEDRPEPRIADASSQFMDRLDAIEQRLMMIWKALQKYMSGTMDTITPTQEMTPPTPTDLSPSSSIAPDEEEEAFTEEDVADFGGTEDTSEEAVADEATVDLNKLL
ncbi:hypothetical protein JW872_00670 [Candidatus Babeliales bacterium]|nr:hypothetical protein [Candidatus Babeliales bacterium]